MGLLLLLAQTADATEGLPPWAKYILGPVGVLVLLLVYAWRTEKHRIPDVIKQIQTAQAALQLLRDSHKGEMDALRKKCDEDEDKLRKEIATWRDKHTKERSVRAWWQSKAEGFAKQLGEESGIPPDIDKTFYRDDD
jgi:hypothetical protein